MKRITSDLDATDSLLQLSMQESSTRPIPRSSSLLYNRIAVKLMQLWVHIKKHGREITSCTDNNQCNNGRVAFCQSKQKASQHGLWSETQDSA